MEKENKNKIIAKVGKVVLYTEQQVVLIILLPYVDKDLYFKVKDVKLK